MRSLQMTEAAESSDGSDLETLHVNHKVPSVALAENVYGAGLGQLVSICMGSEHCGLGLVMFPILVFNVSVQIYTLMLARDYVGEPSVVRIREAYAEFHATAFPNGTFSQERFDAWEHKSVICSIPFAHPHFYYMVLLLWTLAVFKDLKESCELSTIWFSIPGCSSGVAIANGDDIQGDSPLEVEAVCLRVKVIGFAIIIFPKMAIAVFLWLVGTRWLTSTADFENLILNAVALAFIIDVDELVYKCLVPVRARTWFARFLLPVRPNHDQRRMKQIIIIVQAAGKFTAVIGIPLLYMYVFQEVLPGYKFDVGPACQDIFESAGLYR